MEPKLFVALCVLIVGLPLLATDLTSRYWRKRYGEKMLEVENERVKLLRAIHWWQRLAYSQQEENEKLREASK